MNLKTLLRAIGKPRPKFRRARSPKATRRNLAHIAILSQYRPRYWGPSGLETATLHKIDVSPVNGEVVAYYDVRGHRYLWRVINGKPCEIRHYEKGR